MTQVVGQVPLFEFESDLKVKDDLKEMGITSVFTRGEADLSNLTTDSEQFIMDAFHRGKIEFSNDGIKASAATAFMGGKGAGMPFDYEWDVPLETIDLTFDKPFLFLIRDKGTGEVWFTGAVYEGIKQ